MLLSLITRGSKFVIGLAFVGVLMWALLGTVMTLVSDPPKETVEHEFHLPPKELSLASDGPFGKFDERQLQRGFQVYSEVCAQCHSLGLVAFRDLEEIGYTEAEVKKIAKDWGANHGKTRVLDAKGGTWGERDNLPSDRFPKVYYAGTGSPPDLTLMTKARHEGPAYVYSLLTGYQDQPAELIEKFKDAKTPVGMFYNPYFANLNIAMPPPLTSEGQVKYLDGTRATVDQMSKDVAAFLVWTAEPSLQKRHGIGIAVVLFLLLTTFLAYGAYLSVWRGVKH